MTEAKRRPAVHTMTVTELSLEMSRERAVARITLAIWDDLRDPDNPFLDDQALSRAEEAAKRAVDALLDPPDLEYWDVPRLSPTHDRHAVDQWRRLVRAAYPPERRSVLEYL